MLLEGSVGTECRTKVFSSFGMSCIFLSIRELKQLLICSVLRKNLLLRVGGSWKIYL